MITIHREQYVTGWAGPLRTLLKGHPPPTPCLMLPASALPPKGGPLLLQCPTGLHQTSTSVPVIHNTDFTPLFNSSESTAPRPGPEPAPRLSAELMSELRKGEPLMVTSVASIHSVAHTHLLGVYSAGSGPGPCQL